MATAHPIRQVSGTILSPTSSLLTRENACAAWRCLREDDEYRGYRIPKGTLVTVNTRFASSMSPVRYDFYHFSSQEELLANVSTVQGGCRAETKPGIVTNIRLLKGRYVSI